MQREGQVRIPSGCAIAGIFAKDGRRIPGDTMIQSIATMHDRSNGLGGGFAGYGIYPEYKDLYAFHVFYDTMEARESCERFLDRHFDVVNLSKIPIKKTPKITNEPLIWRYFVSPLPTRLADSQLDEREYTARCVIRINTQVKGAYIFSCGKNMGVFKAVGFPEDVGEFYRLGDYSGYGWTAHGRYPTNTPGWWGGAHPFAMLDYSVVHNGEISSYDANRRYIEMFGYKCTLLTDTEVITYIIDYLNRRQGLTLEEVASTIAASFWSTIERKPPAERERLLYLRNRFPSLLITGPFSILLGFNGGMMALNDRLKLRSMVVAEKGDMTYMASEECAIRAIESNPDRIWSPKGGEPVIVTLKEELKMPVNYFYPEYEVVRDQQKCIQCRVCERQCANEVHSYDPERNLMLADDLKCVNCHRCVTLCPTRALKIVKTDHTFKENSNWSKQTITEVYRQAESGGVLLSSMGNPLPYPVYWDKMLINASQVTNPSIDPLREPMETKVYLGQKSADIQRDADGHLINNLSPYLTLSVPVMFSAMSYGSISYNAHESLARAATELGTYYNTGEGGLHEDFYQYGKNTIVQVASGRFGVHKAYLEAGAAIEIKMGQGAKPGIGGHLPGEKIVGDVSRTRMIPEGSDAISPAPHHDIYSIEDLRQLVDSLKETTDYKKPVIVKIAAVHNVAAIASGIARSGADIIAIDGFRGGTGAAPTRIRDNVGIPIELALASVDERLRQEGIRDNVSIVVGGSIRSSADVIKAVALGADAVYIATAALLALGCHLCRSCQTGKCNWGIATQRPELVKRLNPNVGYHRLVNLITAWDHEIKEMMGGMGINSIEALKGNRLMLRGVGMTEKELEILGIKHAGE